MARDAVLAGHQMAETPAAIIKTLVEASVVRSERLDRKQLMLENAHRGSGANQPGRQSGGKHDRALFQEERDDAVAGRTERHANRDLAPPLLNAIRGHAMNAEHREEAGNRGKSRQHRREERRARELAVLADHGSGRSTTACWSRPAATDGHRRRSRPAADRAHVERPEPPTDSGVSGA